MFIIILKLIQIRKRKKLKDINVPDIPEESKILKL